MELILILDTSRHLLKPREYLEGLGFRQRYWSCGCCTVVGNRRTISGGRANLRHLLVGLVEDVRGGNHKGNPGIRIVVERGLLLRARCSLYDQRAGLARGEKGVDVMRKEVEKGE